MPMEQLFGIINNGNIFNIYIFLILFPHASIFNTSEKKFTMKKKSHSKLKFKISHTSQPHLWGTLFAALGPLFDRFASNSYNSAQKSWNFMKLSWLFNFGLLRWYMMSKMTPSSKTLVRNHQPPPSMHFLDGGFLTHF